MPGSVITGMPLTWRTVLFASLFSLAAAAVLAGSIGQLRARDRARTLERVSASVQTELARETCETDPQWFLAGPRLGRPRMAERNIPDADVKLPRPSREELPFEFFAYDEQYLGSSVAAPRFPDEFKRLMRQSPPQRVVAGEYESEHGTGLQIARWTGWVPGPCAVLLFRLAPDARPWSSVGLFLGAFAAVLGVALAIALPTARRIRRLSIAARESAKHDYTAMTPISGRDEIGSLGAVFNDAASDIRLRVRDAADREDTLQRFVGSVSEDVAAPLAALTDPLARLVRNCADHPEANRAAREVSLEAHRLSMRLRNLAAVHKLRGITESAPRERIDLSAMTEMLIAERAALANAAGVAPPAASIDPGVVVQADAGLMEQAVANLIDNAILHAGARAAIRVELRSFEHGNRFSLRVLDTGHGVSDPDFAELSANRRFRGDEAKTRRPGGRGLGLALAREVADRFGMTLELRRPTAGGFEVELASR